MPSKKVSDGNLVIRTMRGLGMSVERIPLKQVAQTMNAHFGLGCPEVDDRHAFVSSVADALVDRGLARLSKSQMRTRKRRIKEEAQRSSEPRRGKGDRLQAFYKSWEWKRLRYDVLKERGRKCECCNTTAVDGARIIVDHIKPLRFNWGLRLDKTNMQVLCDDCNMGKGSRDETDWRETNRAPSASAP